FNHLHGLMWPMKTFLAADNFPGNLFAGKQNRPAASYKPPFPTPGRVHSLRTPRSAIGEPHSAGHFKQTIRGCISLVPRPRRVELFGINTGGILAREHPRHIKLMNRHVED